jgi:hypothetical protein
LWVKRAHQIIAGVLLLVILLADARTRYRQTSQALEPVELPTDALEGAGIQAAAFTLADL